MHCCTIIGWLSEWSFCSSKSSEGVKRLANAQVYSLCFCYWRVFFSVESTNKSCPPSSCSDHPKMLLSHKCWYEAVLGGNLLCCWIWRIPYKATYHTCSRVNLLFLFQNQRLEVGFQPIRESGQVMRDTSSHEGRMQRKPIQRNGRNTLVWNSGGALLFLWRSAPPESRAFYRSYAKRTARFGNNVCYSKKLDSLLLMGPPHSTRQGQQKKNLCGFGLTLTYGSWICGFKRLIRSWNKCAARDISPCTLHGIPCASLNHTVLVITHECTTWEWSQLILV